jgi:antitoxin Phd
VSDLMATWQLQDAKSRLSELIDKANAEGPQTITRRGEPAAVVLSADAYEQLRMQKEGADFIDVLLNQGPKFDHFEIERDKDTGREIELE